MRDTPLRSVGQDCAWLQRVLHLRSLCNGLVCSLCSPAYASVCSYYSIEGNELQTLQPMLKVTRLEA